MRSRWPPGSWTVSPTLAGPANRGLTAARGGPPVVRPRDADDGAQASRPPPPAPRPRRSRPPARPAISASPSRASAVPARWPMRTAEVERRPERGARLADPTGAERDGREQPQRRRLALGVAHLAVEAERLARPAGTASARVTPPLLDRGEYIAREAAREALADRLRVAPVHAGRARGPRRAPDGRGGAGRAGPRRGPPATGRPPRAIGPRRPRNAAGRGRRSRVPSRPWPGGRARRPPSSGTPAARAEVSSSSCQPLRVGEIGPAQVQESAGREQRQSGDGVGVHRWRAPSGPSAAPRLWHPGCPSSARGTRPGGRPGPGSCAKLHASAARRLSRSVCRRCQPRARRRREQVAPGPPRPGRGSARRGARTAARRRLGVRAGRRRRRARSRATGSACCRPADRRDGPSTTRRAARSGRRRRCRHRPRRQLRSPARRGGRRRPRRGRSRRGRPPASRRPPAPRRRAARAPTRAWRPGCGAGGPRCAVAASRSAYRPSRRSDEIAQGQRRRAGRGELDREREAVEPTTELTDERRPRPG